jgi:hypothetical protein
MAAIELLDIDLAVIYGDGPGATLRFRITPADGKAEIEPFVLEVSVPRQGNLDSTVDRGFRAIHRMAHALEEKLRPPG